MRRVTLWVLSTVAVLVLLFTYRTSTMGPTTTPPAAIAAAPGQNAPAAARAGSGGGTYEGSVAQTRWGPVQVTITVSGGRITGVDVPVFPAGNRRDEEINAFALPVLRQETVEAQSAEIDTVSGATVTSDGYIASLQAALDAAHLS
ncbi:FMN-binding protein [Sphaerisporangium corydalis]|uniref:FMN-binding protein n=1 Tax=Sphaerisporangium corydalis TaxID=1441875 RepID=A0ABV9E7L2_9ACTN|nr:FMN-binding protein [Sphaerisporangium corydalis]